MKNQAPPEGGEPIEWLLLTTVAVETIEDAIERVQWYSCRWGIEVWHRILQSGCRIEARQLENRRSACVAVWRSTASWRGGFCMPPCWRVRCPRRPVSVLLDPEEWQALYCAIHRCPSATHRAALACPSRPHGLPSWAVLSDAVAEITPALKSCGGVFNISVTSRPCTALCDQLFSK